MRKPNEAEELRADIARAQGRGKLARYEPELRERISRLAAERRGRGEPAWAVAADLGLSYQTLRRWARASGGVRAPPGTFRPVALAEEADGGARQSFVLHGPAGVSVTGLSVSELASLLRSLAP